MGDSNYEIVHNHYATEATGIAALNSKDWAYVQDTRRQIVMDGATPRYYWDATRLADQTTSYGTAIIGTPGITGVTPSGGASGAAATLQAMLSGLAGTGNVNFIWNGTGQQASSNFNISGAGVIGTTLAVAGTILAGPSGTVNPVGNASDITSSAGSSGDVVASFTARGFRTTTNAFAGLYGYHGSTNTANILFVRDAANDAGAVYIQTKATGGSLVNTIKILSTGVSSFTTTTDATTSALASVIMAGGLGVAKSVWSGSYFLSELTGKNSYVINSAGSNFGFISNIATDVWGLTYGTVQTTLGTSVLQWDSTKLVSMLGNVAVTGRVNINGAVDTAGYYLNIKSGAIACDAGNPLYSFGVGDPSATNNEYTYLRHTGANAILDVDKGGTGIVRSLLIRTGGVAALTITSAQAATFSSSVAVTGNLTVATTKFTVDASTGNTQVAGTFNCNGVASIGGALGSQNGLYIGPTTTTATQTGIFNDFHPGTATTNGQGILCGFTASNSGTMTNGYHINMLAPSLGGSGITNFYGIKMADFTSATSNWAIKTGLGLVEFGDNVLVKTSITTGQPSLGVAGKIGLGDGSGTAFTSLPSSSVMPTLYSIPFQYWTGSAWETRYLMAKAGSF